MNNKTLKALKGSIKKWEKIVDGTGVDKSGDNCPLCDLHGSEDICGNCPVMRETGDDQCHSTPYSEWVDHWNCDHGMCVFPKDVRCPTCEKLAVEELAFLESLLPKVAKK